MVIGLIKMFGDGSRIRKVAIVENGAAMLPKALMEMALGLPNVLFATFFSFIATFLECLFCNKEITGNNKTQRFNKARFS